MSEFRIRQRKRFLDREEKLKRRKERDGLKPNPVDWYSSSAWKKARREFLSYFPVCVKCNAERATVIDHIKPHRGDERLFWDVGNWQAVCRKCHNRKTALQDSNFAGKRGIFKPRKDCGDDGLPVDPEHPWNQ